MTTEALAEPRAVADGAAGDSSPSSARERAWAEKVASRFALLGIRTDALGVVAVVGAALGLTGVIRFASRLGSDGVVAWAARLQEIHVPIDSAGFFASRAPGTSLVVLFTFVVVGLLGVREASRRGLRRWERHVWIAVMVALSLGAAAMAWNNNREHAASLRPLRVAIEGQDWRAAQSHLKQHAGGLASAYLLAQIAMKSGDAEGLKTHGTPLLQAVDRMLLRIDGNADQATLTTAAGFRPDILRAIDAALHGAPHGQVSLAGREAPSMSAGSASGRVVRNAAALLASLLGTAAALAVMKVWYRMARRVLRLRGQVKDL